MRAFLDTNVLVYAFSRDRRAERALAALQDGGVVAVQSLNEFASVALRKLGFNWTETRQALAAIETFCDFAAPAGVAVHRHGLDIAQRYRIGIFDAALLGTAIGEECRLFLSEDMQDGLVVEDTLTIRNPFPPQA